MAERLLQQQQHGSSRHSRRAVATNLLLLGVLQLLHGLRQAGAQQQQVVDRLPSVVELWPAEDGEPMLPAQADEEQDRVELSPEQRFAGPSGRALHLQPSVLDFGTQQLGTPRVKTLHVYNPSRDTDVFVNSVFTASRHFHVSPFQNRVVPAGGNVSLRVVFLPTEQGNIESSVFINTSAHNVLPYQVFGVGASETSPNIPERLLGHTHLLFPTFEDIQPSQTQPGATNTSLLQIRLKCDFINVAHRMPKKTCLSAYRSLQLQISLVLRTDTGRSSSEDLQQYISEHLFVVFVAAATSDSSHESAVHIYMLNSGNYLVELQDVHNLFQSEMMLVISQPILLQNSASNFSKAASLTCRAVSRDHDVSCLGEIRMNLLGQSTPLQACLFHQVTEGFFGLDPSAASFHIQPHYVASGMWSMWLTNNFDFSIVLHNVVVGREARTVLKIVNFNGLLNLPPGCWNVFSLKLNAKDPPSTVFTNVYLTTNLGVRFEIPLQIHSTLTQRGDQRFEAIAQCGKHSYFKKSDAESLRWQKSLSLDHSTWKVDSDLGSELYERYWKTKYGDTCRRHFLLRPKDVWQQKREDGSFAFFWPHLVSKPGLLLNFSTTALKNSTMGFFTLRNPSSSLVAVQLLPLSSYPAPQAVLDLLGKWFGINSNSVNFTTDEFRLAKECTVRNENHQDLITMKPGLEVLHLRLNPWESRRIGVIFTPADNKKVTSLIMIRNNLTILDVVSVEGTGAKESLKVGGRLPGTGGSLRFKVPESTLMDCRQQLRNSKHILSITKIFKVENIGPVPITISSMKINGYTCQGFGFEVLDCHPFFLDQNSSREIGIVFVPDFTSSWVIRELTLLTASDLEFHFTLNVTLPHHLLPLCADGVPGPSWEESFWMLTVLCVSLSLLGVVLIAFQQAQYILTEFMKSRTRQTPVSTLHHNNNSIDAISSDSYRSTCKAFVDSCSPPDKGKGKGFLSVSGTSRNQNASKRSPATYSHSQKKHKCSVYYSKPKTNSSASSTASTPDDKLPQQLADGMPLFPKDLCVDAYQENWTDLTCVSGIDTDLQTHLSLPGSPLEKDELALKNTILVKRHSLESDLKEDLQNCVFPKETGLRTADTVTELKEPVICSQHSVRKQPECLLLQNTPPPSPVEPPSTPQKNEGPAWQLCSRKEKEGCENSKKQRCNNLSVENTVYKAKETKCCGTLDLQSSEHEDALRKKRSPEKRDGNLPSMNWNKNRTSARRNKKKNSNTTARVPEQSELPHLCTEFERPELKAGRLRSWYPAENGNNCKSDHKQGSLPTHGETENFHSSKQNCREKFSSDSSSDCGSSRGSVRASRGSWGSWSSTSSSDGDKRPGNIPRNVVPSRENIFQTEYSVESPVTLNLPPSICSSPIVKTAPHFPEILPPYTDVATDTEKAKGVYPTEDIWATQPICLANGLNYSIGNNLTCMMREHPAVQNSFMDWSGPSDGQFSNMYGHLETNDFGTFHEDNLNYPHPGFPCPEVQSPPYIDHSCPSSWNMSVPTPPPPPPPPPQSMPVAWESANYVSSSPYLSSTRSLSPMSGLFGSIWAPQNDMYDGYCPVSPTSPLTDHVENPAVICKQEYSPRFNPFNAYMNLDIWATTANRNATFPLSRDSGYCGNM